MVDFLSWRGRAATIALAQVVTMLAAAQPPAAPMGAYANGVFPLVAPGEARPLVLEEAWPGLQFPNPLGVVAIPATDAHLVPCRGGEVFRIQPGEDGIECIKVLHVPWLALVGEAGLQSVAIPPGFAVDGAQGQGTLYAIYSIPANGSAGTAPQIWRLSRYLMDEESEVFDPASEEILIELPWPAEIHFGGGMFFHPVDGFLYLSMGDGAVGSNAQQLDRTLSGGIIRIDVHSDPTRSIPIERQPEAGFTQGYGIPLDNPWVDHPQALGEYYAIGLRNPFRMHHDAVTGESWIGEVGNARFEEINRLVAGANYQWPIMEGLEGPAWPAHLPGIPMPPIHTYGRDSGYAVIGGPVYRGTQLEDLVGGLLLFGDYVRGVIWALDTSDPASGAVIVGRLRFPPGSPFAQLASFGEDQQGEVLVSQLGNPEGQVFRLVRRQEGDEPQPPATLSATGALALAEGGVPTAAAGWEPYTVNSPLWSDGAEKWRWGAFPYSPSQPYLAGVLTFADTGAFGAQAGVVLMKHFALADATPGRNGWRPVETRFLIMDDNLGSYGLTYRWREDGSDADLVDVDGHTEEITTLGDDDLLRHQTWSYPSRSQCLECHTPAARYVLGLSAAQLHTPQGEPSEDSEPSTLEVWRAQGRFANPPDDARLAAVEAMVPLHDTTAPIDLRFRSYLEANCASCHLPSHPIRASFDARFAKLPAGKRLIGESTFEPSDKVLIKPGDPEGSYLWQRLATSGPGQMPPLGRHQVDEAAVAMLTEYIQSLVPPSASEPWRHTTTNPSYPHPGYAHPVGDSWEVGGTGYMWANWETVELVHRPVWGDFDLEVEVERVSYPGRFSTLIAGLIAMEAASMQTRYFTLTQTLGSQGTQIVELTRRLDGDSYRRTTVAAEQARWLRISRRGNVFTFWTSAEGVEWTQRATRTLSLSPRLEVGIAFGGSLDGELNSARFSHLRLEAAPYDQWIGSHLWAAGITDWSRANPSADPDGDGLSNALEYRLGTDPGVAQADGPLQAALADTDLLVHHSESRLVTAGNIRIEGSADLHAWSSEGVVEIHRTADGEVDRVTSRLPAGWNFARLVLDP